MAAESSMGWHGIGKDPRKQFDVLILDGSQQAQLDERSKPHPGGAPCRHRRKRRPISSAP